MGRRPPTTAGVSIESMGYHVALSTFSRFGTIPACDGQTDRRTDGHTMTANTRARIASRG